MNGQPELTRAHQIGSSSARLHPGRIAVKIAEAAEIRTNSTERWNAFALAAMAVAAAAAALAALAFRH